MADRHGFALFASAAQRQFELFANRGHFGHVVQERDVSEGGANPKLLRRIVGYRSGGGMAVDVEEVMGAPERPQLRLQVEVAGGLRALLVFVGRAWPGN